MNLASCLCSIPRSLQGTSITKTYVSGRMCGSPIPLWRDQVTHRFPPLTAVFTVVGRMLLAPCRVISLLVLTTQFGTAKRRAGFLILALFDGDEGVPADLATDDRTDLSGLFTSLVRIGGAPGGRSVPGLAGASGREISCRSSCGVASRTSSGKSASCVSLRAPLR